MKWLQHARNRRRLTYVLAGMMLLALAAPFVLGRDARHLSAFREGDEEAGLARAEMATAASSVDAVLATPHLLDEVRQPERVLFVILGPERRYDADETRAVVDFVKRGGRVLLADEGGFGTDLAREAGWAFGSQRVLDTRNHLGDPRLVVADATLGDATHRVLFNSPSVLREVGPTDADVLAQTSGAAYPNGSFLDINGNGEIDRADPAGPFPLVVRARLGEGVVVLVADTGLFMDRQVRLTDYGNAAFLRALAATLVPSDGRILLDDARHAPPAATALWDNALRTLGRATTGPLAPLLLVLALVGLAALAWRLTRPTEDWTHHAHDVGAEVPAPEALRPDLARAQRLARRRISEKHNIAIEQVAMMDAEALLRLTGDKLLSEAAAGTLRSDPAPLFPSFSKTEVSP